MSETYTVKLKRRKAKSSFFTDEASSKITTGSEVISRSQERVSTTFTINVPSLDMADPLASSTTAAIQVTKNVRIFGEATAITFDEFRYGKDVKNTKHLLNGKLTPNLALSDEGINDGDDEFSNVIGEYNFGQSISFKTAKNDQNFSFIPFRDTNGKTNPAVFISKTPLLTRGFPFVYDSRSSYDQFLDSRDREFLNGVIDVFHNHLRNSEISDISLKGAKANVGYGNDHTTQNSSLTKKGSPFGSSVYETNITQHDFFEDGQEIILNLTSSNSQVGYMSSGKFKLSPFTEKNLFINEYSHLTNAQKNTLLISSSRQEQTIGTRFKSKQNGFIITPFYQLNQKRSFGKDSIAFSGLLKG